MDEQDLKILDEIDAKLEGLVFAFVENFNLKVSKEIQNSILDFIDTLSSDLDLTSRLERNKVINKFRDELAKTIQNGAIADGYLTLLTGYKEIVAIANEYFSALSSAYKKELYREIYKESILYLKESLTGAGISQIVSNKIVDKIYDLNMTGITKKELRAYLKDYFSKANITTRYVEQITTDSLYQMTQTYQLKISNDLGIEYYYYAGTKMKTSRQFCISRYGKVFTKKEIQSWPELNWAGKIPGTDKNTIFVYRGGYNCRHTLRPISKNLYQKLNK
ncbi:MAG: hypothetical protein IPP61_00305 [Cytophagaceae bacterium]|nr:hypothetical protein [Cytophagaceae bacterium]MBL0304287.1 hypothetical protein [Cytophagaceae bacterium]MBL0323621.1 hypothetical protein [Cytophagaceae bacterium]